MSGGSPRIANHEPVPRLGEVERLPARVWNRPIIDVPYSSLPAAPALPVARGSWFAPGAVVSGVVLAMGLVISLSVTGYVTGIVAPATPAVPVRQSVLPEVLWSGLSTLVALTAGGWLAGWRSGGGQLSGLLHGIAVGFVSGSLIVALAVTGYGAAAGDIAGRLVHILEITGVADLSAVDNAHPALTQSGFVDGLLAAALVVTSSTAGACIGRNDRLAVIRRRALRLSRGR